MGAADPPLTVRREVLDERQWAWVSGPYQMLGSRFSLQSDDPEVGGVLDLVLGSFRDPGPSGWSVSVMAHQVMGRPGFGVYRGTERVAMSPDADHLIRIVSWRLTQLAIKSVPDRLPLHCGVVSLDGVVVLVPGVADAGKSTLVATLVLAGFDYLTDEVAVLHLDENLVDPFPRAISLDPGSFDLLPEDAYLAEARELVRKGRFVVPERVGTPAPVGVVVLPTVRAGAPSRLEPIRKVDALEALARNAFDLGRHGAVGVRALAAAVEVSDCYRLTFGTLPAAVDAVAKAVMLRASNRAN